jgi:hypothetical protein
LRSARSRDGAPVHAELRPVSTSVFAGLRLRRPRLLASIPVALALAATLTLAGCGIDPPYAPNQKPEVAELMAAATPKLSSVQVPRAKVRQGGGPAANLMLVAESPERFAGTIQVSGNELVSLAVNEDEYGLRWVGGREGAKALTPGYYSGPPSRCAVETLLGVDLEPEGFVAMVLGGAPLIDPPHEITDRRWDRKQGRELLTIENGRFEQQLAFAWFADQWQFAGAQTWALDGKGGRRWLWTISHEELHHVNGEILPAKTKISRPKKNGRGERTLTVTFIKQVANPSFGGELPEDPPPDEGGDGEGGEELPENAGDTWEEDDWGDDEGWESADGSGETPGEEGGAVEPEPKPEPPPIPPQFRGNPTGLTPRGDLCAGRR